MECKPRCIFIFLLGHIEMCIFEKWHVCAWIYSTVVTLIPQSFAINHWKFLSFSNLFGWMEDFNYNFLIFVSKNSWFTTFSAFVIFFYFDAPKFPIIFKVATAWCIVTKPYMCTYFVVLKPWNRGISLHIL